MKNESFGLDPESRHTNGSDNRVADETSPFWTNTYVGQLSNLSSKDITRVGAGFEQTTSAVLWEMKQREAIGDLGI